MKHGPKPAAVAVDSGAAVVVEDLAGAAVVVDSGAAVVAEDLAVAAVEVLAAVVAVEEEAAIAAVVEAADADTRKLQTRKDAGLPACVFFILLRR